MADGGGEVGYGWDSADERGAAKETAEGDGDSARGRGDGGITLADVAVGGTGGEPRCLGVQRFHVGHGLFDSKRAWGNLARGGIKIGGRSAREGMGGGSLDGLRGHRLVVVVVRSRLEWGIIIINVLSGDRCG